MSLTKNGVLFACYSCHTAVLLLYLLSTVLTAQLVECTGKCSSSSLSLDFQLDSTNSGRQLSRDAVNPTSPASKPGAAVPKATTVNQTSSGTYNSGSSRGSSSIIKGPCKWDADDFTCNAGSKAWLSAGPGMPSSPYRRAVLMALARDKHCSQYTTAAACMRDVSRRCFWQASPNGNEPSAGRCASSDMEEMLLFSSKGFNPAVPVIPFSLTCPGTAAHSFYECYAHAGNLESCKMKPTCMALPLFGGSLKNVCMAKMFGNWTLGQLWQLFADLEQLSPRVYGKCAAACWLQQARICSNSTEQTCKQLPFCAFMDGSAAAKRNSILRGGSGSNDSDDSDSDGESSSLGGRLAAARAVKPTACRHEAREFSNDSALDMAVQKIHKHCQSKASEEGCSSVVVQTGTAAVAAAARREPVVIWENYQPSSTAVQCALAV